MSARPPSKLIASCPSHPVSVHLSILSFAEDRINGQLESMFYEMERPCVFEHHGQWHMLVSSPIINRNPRWKAAHLVENRGARLFHFVADRVSPNRRCHQSRRPRHSAT